MAIAKNGGISFSELASVDIFEFFIIFNQLETELIAKKAKAENKKK